MACAGIEERLENVGLGFLPVIQSVPVLIDQCLEFTVALARARVRRRFDHVHGPVFGEYDRPPGIPGGRP